MLVLGIEPEEYPALLTTSRLSRLTQHSSAFPHDSLVVPFTASSTADTSLSPAATRWPTTIHLFYKMLHGFFQPNVGVLVRLLWGSYVTLTRVKMTRVIAWCQQVCPTAPQELNHETPGSKLLIPFMFVPLLALCLT